MEKLKDIYNIDDSNIHIVYTVLFNKINELVDAVNEIQEERTKTKYIKDVLKNAITDIAIDPTSDLVKENEKLKKIIQEQHQIIKQQQKTIIEHISKEIGI